MANAERITLTEDHLDVLIGNLHKDGYRVIAPRLEGGAIGLDEIRSVKDLPRGWNDEHGPGTYVLKRDAGEALFASAVGPGSMKRFLFPPEVRLWKATRDGSRFEIHPESHHRSPKFAFLGVRPCDVHALAVQDAVLQKGRFVDADYVRRRKDCLIVAVNCTSASANCFCTSMKTGPKATMGFDLAFTEILDGDRHVFVMETGSEQGRAIIKDVPHEAATDADCQLAEAAVQETARRMRKQLSTDGIRELLQRRFDDRRWDQTAERCLACANCTMVCPTCFCMNVEDATDVSGAVAERWRRWDSCFTQGHTYLHGGSVRFSGKGRYRQWMTHKLSYWIDQFGVSGCVGCGRCITWCPVGIDITEEARALRDNDRNTSTSNQGSV